MRMLRRGLRAYGRDQRGAYAVMFALMGGFIAAAAQIGTTAYRTQNSATAAEQLIDLTCQKLASADPALYPTGEAAAAAAQQAMDARLAHGLRETQGTFTVTADKNDPNLVVPINRDETNADLRRFEFVVSYTGQVTGINSWISPTRATNIAVTKRCRPVCKGMTNIVYSNPIAVGHWWNGRTLLAAQEINPAGSVKDNFDVVEFVPGFNNPGNDQTRYVLSIMDESASVVRYRRIITLPLNIYIDTDSFRTPGEPAAKKITRIVAGEFDQLFLQSLNADGSLPGVCGEEREPPPCVGAACCVGTGCQCVGDECDPPPPRRFTCDFGVSLPRVGNFRDLRLIPDDGRRAVYTYPVNDRPGKLNINYSNRAIRILLAPFYVKNEKLVNVELRRNVTKTMTAEVASALSLTMFNRHAKLSRPQYKYLVAMVGVHSFFVWDGNEKCSFFQTPIVFDTEQLGEIKTTMNAGTEEPVHPHFDYLGNGRKDRVEWPIGKGQAWLVDNRDGKAASDMSGKRFFGDLSGHMDGYEKLRELDTSGTGVLSGRDLDGLVLWFDNGNAIVEDGELRGLHDIGVTAVDTRAEWQELPDGRVALRATALMNGKTIMTEDIFVAIESKAVPLTDVSVMDASER